MIAIVAMSFPLASVQAQAIGENGRVVYEAAFFHTFSPANALDIVKRIPGFVLEEGDSEVRGFSQAAGNVVINGRRPSSKSDTLEIVLARIPASRVLRIEIASGEQFGSDYIGKPQVVNIVLSAQGGVAGTVEGTVRREFTGVVFPEGGVSALIRRGPSTFNLAVKVTNTESSEIGYDSLTDLASGKEIEHRLKLNRIRDPEGQASASWALEEGDNRSAHLNASLAIGKFRLTQSNHVIPQDAPVRDDVLYQRYFGRTIEVGGDVTRPLLGGGIKLLGLATRRYRDRDDVQLLDGGTLGGDAQKLRDWSDESVARLTWSRDKLAGWSAELGIEGALNRLNSKVDLNELAPDGTATRIDLPIDDAIVTEYRGEVFANAGRALTSALHLDLRLTYEASRLTVKGDVSARRSLQFLKPKVALDWKIGAWQTQVSVQRTVAQLNFEDFISYAELSNDRVNGGNADLLPQRAWEFLASVNRKILGDGRVKFDLGYNFIEKVQDRVPTPEGFDAPGNLGDGSEFSAVGTINLPLARFGIKGGRLSLYGSYVKTRVRDPYTLLYRPFSNFSLFYFETEFRQDLGKFAWGITTEGSTVSTSYRRDETDSLKGVMPLVSAFVEYRPSRKWTFTLGANNILDGHAYRSRDFFTPDRTNLVPDLNEYRWRNQHVIGRFTIKRNFG